MTLIRASELRCEGSTCLRTLHAVVPGATHPELGARLVVLVVEVGGRWPPDTQSFLSQLASARARAERFDAQTRGTSMAISVERPVAMLSCSGCCTVTCWRGRWLEVRMALVRRHMRWTVLVCTRVCLSDFGHWCFSLVHTWSPHAPVSRVIPSSDEKEFLQCVDGTARRPARPAWRRNLEVATIHAQPVRNPTRPVQHPFWSVDT